MKKNISVGTVYNDGEPDTLSELLSQLDGHFVRHYGSLEVNDIFIEFYAWHGESFTQSELNESVRVHIESMRNDALRELTDAEIEEFLKV